MAFIVVREWNNMDEWEYGPFETVEEAESYAIDQWDRLSRFEKKDKNRGIEVCAYTSKKQHDSGDIQWSRDVHEVMEKRLKKERNEIIRECAKSPRVLKSEMDRLEYRVDADYVMDLYENGWRGSDDIGELMSRTLMGQKDANETLLYLALYELSLKNSKKTVASNNRRSNDSAKKPTKASARRPAKATSGRR